MDDAVVEQVVVLQSYAEKTPGNWLGSCMDSVRHWADARGYRYEFCDDTLLTLLPEWYRSKVGDRLPILTDLARLLWIEQTDADYVIWFDADVLLFAPQRLRLRCETSCCFGYEHWWQEDRVRKNVHNAYCVFQRGCPILPFLIEATQRLIHRVDADHLAPQLVGPKLLTSLHNIVGFELERHIGAISPQLAAVLVNGHTPELARWQQQLSEPMYGANLCLSLHQQSDAMPLVERLLEFPEGLA